MSAIISGFLFTIGAVLALSALNAFGFWVFVGLAVLAALYFLAPWLLALQIVYPWLGPAMSSIVVAVLVVATIYERAARKRSNARPSPARSASPMEGEIVEDDGLSPGLRLYKALQKDTAPLLPPR
jgi:hypothetical protein